MGVQATGTATYAVDKVTAADASRSFGVRMYIFVVVWSR